MFPGLTSFPVPGLPSAFLALAGFCLYFSQRHTRGLAMAGLVAGVVGSLAMVSYLLMGTQEEGQAFRSGWWGTFFHVGGWACLRGIAGQVGRVVPGWGRPLAFLSYAWCALGLLAGWWFGWGVLLLPLQAMLLLPLIRLAWVSTGTEEVPDDVDW